MADDRSDMFTEKASKKLRSPDDLDEYVRVTNPSGWVVLAACATLMIGLFAWGLFGTVETNVIGIGTCVRGEALCFLSAERASKVHVGDLANVGGVLSKVESISTVPLSRVEAREVVDSDYLTNTLVEGDWTYLVRFADDGEHAFEEDVPIPVTITVERISPLTVIFGAAS